jgi:hypothetical protein
MDFNIIIFPYEKTLACSYYTRHLVAYLVLNQNPFIGCKYLCKLFSLENNLHSSYSYVYGSPSVDLL